MTTKIEKVETPLNTHYEAYVEKKYLGLFPYWMSVNSYLGGGLVYLSQLRVTEYPTQQAAQFALDQYDKWINGTHLRKIVKYSNN